MAAIPHRSHGRARPPVSLCTFRAVANWRPDFWLATQSESNKSAVVEATKPRLLGLLGPGLVTGASDDDPSGIATYSQAGAQFGYATSWTLLLTYPLMVAIQIISARIGRTSGRGVAGNIVRRYPPWVVICVTIPLLAANIINIGADLGAMGDAVRLLAGGGALVYVVSIGSRWRKR